MGNGPQKKNKNIYLPFSTCFKQKTPSEGTRSWQTSRDFVSWKLFGSRHDAMDGRCGTVRGFLMSSQNVGVFTNAKCGIVTRGSGVPSVNQKNWGTSLRMTTFTTKWQAKGRNKMRLENQPVICFFFILGKMKQPPLWKSKWRPFTKLLAGLQDDEWIPRILDPTCPGQSLVMDFVEKWGWNETYPPEHSRLDHLKTTQLLRKIIFHPRHVWGPC